MRRLAAAALLLSAACGLPAAKTPEKATVSVANPVRTGLMTTARPDSLVITVTNDAGILAVVKVPVPVDTLIPPPLVIHDTIPRVCPACVPPPPPPPAPAPTPPPPPPAPTPPPPPPSSTTPSGFDPARLGSQYLAGHSIQGLQQAGDTGFAALLASGNGGSIGATPTPATPALLARVPDPRGVFGWVVRITHPSQSASTIIRTAQFPPTRTFWFRQTILLKGEDKHGTNIAASFPQGWYSTDTDSPGESGEQKMMFAWPTDSKSRMQMVLQKTGHLALGCGNGEIPVPTTTSMTMTPSTPVQPQPPGTFAGLYMSSYPGGKVGDTTKATYPHANALGDQDWYEWTLNYSELSPTEYIQRYFLRRLTVNGVWSPWRDAAWIGCHQTGGLSKAYNRVQWTGNRSGRNIGPHAQYTFGGPWEVTSAKDPYQLDRYGRP